MAENNPITVKYRTVSISIYPWVRGHHHYWRYKQGEKFVVRSTLEAAKAAATKHAQATYKGQLDVSTLTPSQAAAVQRMLAADPTCRLIDDFLAWKEKKFPVKNSRDAVAEFLAVKMANQGLSSHNVEILTRHLKKLPNADLGDITPGDLPEIPGNARTRSNVIAAWITFFRWCVRQNYLPRGEETAPEKLEKPIIKRAIPTTYTPAELGDLLRNVATDYSGWLACAAFAGLRTEELCPAASSAKSPLNWSDLHWDRGIIIVRPETDKTGRRRIVPILPALHAVLWPIRKESGNIGPKLPPHTPKKGGVMSETTRLGKFIGGWKRNALRHSFISYRAAEVGIAQAAMEAGNSETESKKSYNDAKGQDESSKWFSTGCNTDVPQ